MRKLTYILGALALTSVLFASCEKKSQNSNLDEVVEDGFYVAGAATGQTGLAPSFMMAAGINEAAEQTKRDGMFEKYVVLDANKDFELLHYEAGKKTRYSAALAGFTPDFEKEIYADNPDMEIYKGKLVTGDDAKAMKVTKKGLYHIVLDLNKKKDLNDAQIIVAPVKWGIRGGMNGWGFTEMTLKEEDGSLIYTVKDCDAPANCEFKFSYGGWKITLDEAGKVKANTNLGAVKGDTKKLLQGGENIIAGPDAGLYDITLKFKMTGGELGASFTYETKLTKKSELPTTLYMIGEEFGNWDWSSTGVVDMIPFHSQPGMFWAIRYISQNKGFKFSPVKEWKDDFASLDTNEGFKVEGDNAVVEESGIYCVGVDLKNKKIVVEKAPVYGIGDAFGSWDIKKNPYVVDGKTMKIQATATGNLRTYVASSLLSSENDWWHAEFIVNNEGKIEYRGTGGDPAAVNVDAGKTITFDFNAGTGTIQ